MQYDKEIILRYNLFQIKGLREQSSILGGVGVLSQNIFPHYTKKKAFLHEKNQNFFL